MNTIKTKRRTYKLVRYSSNRINQSGGEFFSGLGIELETSFFHEKKVKQIGLFIKENLNTKKFLPDEQLVKDNTFKSSLNDDDEYKFVRLLYLKKIKKEFEFKESKSKPENEEKKELLFQKYYTDGDSSLKLKIENLTKHMNNIDVATEEQIRKTLFDLIGLIFNEKLETNNYGYNMIEIVTSQYKNATIPYILRELELKKEIIIELIRQSDAGKAEILKYGEISYPNRGSTRLIMFRNTDDIIEDDKSSDWYFVSDYVGSYHINTTLPTELDSSIDEMNSKISKIKEIKRQMKLGILTSYSRQYKALTVDDLTSLNEQIKSIKELIGPLKLKLDEAVFLLPIAHDKTSDKYYQEYKKFYDDDGILYNALVEKEKSLFKNLLTMHELWAIYIQYLTPLFLTIYSTPDSSSFLDDHKYSEMSFRTVTSKYSFINSSNIKEKGIPSKRRLDDIPSTYKDIYEKGLEYVNPFKQTIGTDIRRDVERGNKFGFEFRLLDYFDLKYLKEVLALIYLLADHIKSSVIDIETKLKNIINPYNNIIITDQIKEVFKEGWDTKVSKKYFDLINNQLFIGTLKKYDKNLTVYSMINMVYKLLLKFKSSGYYSKIMKIDEMDIPENLTNLNRIYFSNIIESNMSNEVVKSQIDELEKLFKNSFLKFTEQAKDYFINEGEKTVDKKIKEELNDIFYYLLDKWSK